MATDTEERARDQQEEQGEQVEGRAPEEATGEEAAEGSGEEETSERQLLQLGLDPFDVGALGLRVSSEGVDLQLNAIPEDGKVLGQLLAKASDMLGGLQGDGDGGDGSEEGPGLSARLGGLAHRAADQLRRLQEWIMAQLGRLIRFLLAKLAQMAANRLAQAAQNTASKGKSSAQQGGRKAREGGEEAARSGGEQARRGGKEASGTAAAGGSKVVQKSKQAAKALGDIA